MDLGMGRKIRLSPIPDSDPFHPADHSDQRQQFLLLPQEQTHGPCLRKQTAGDRLTPETGLQKLDVSSGVD
jgi:hypothetical protein